MPSAAPKLFKIAPTANGNGTGKRKPGRSEIPWVDVSDSDEKSKKRPMTNENGYPPSKKRKHANGLVNGSAMMNGDSHAATHGRANGHVNGHVYGESSTTLDKQRAIQVQRKKLPIAAGKDALIEEIRQNEVVVLLGETGSGKTTQVPQYLLESGLCGKGMIAVTQPRKVAATSLAARVSQEQNTQLGALVGYAVRFDEKSSPETKIKYLTDGMLVRELLSDSLLSKYSVVIVDEAHERTLRTDLLIANLKQIQKERNGARQSEKGKNKMMPLRIVIMSATLDAEKFSKFFSDAKILYVKGRQHPVKTYYSTTGQTDYLDSAMRTFFQIHTDKPPGDVLIFLPGQEDIEGLEKSIQLYAKRLPPDGMEVLICPMFAAQAPSKNFKVFTATPPNTRKCILATNIAETSITIPGVKYVIDTGKCKEKRYLARETGGGFDTLMTRDITKSSAMQRAGRAGREGPGECYRLYTEDAFNAMPLTLEPEILRVGLTASFLQLKCLGQNLEDLELLDKPDLESTVSALKTLLILGALSASRELTEIGRTMASFPLEPMHARAVVASRGFGCTSEILSIVSVLSASAKLFFDISDQREAIGDARRKFRHPTGDHLTVLRVMQAYEQIAHEPKAVRNEWCKRCFLNERALLEARKIRDQLRGTCERAGIDWRASCGEDSEQVIRSLGEGLVHNAAMLQPDKTYKQLVGLSIVKIHPSSTIADKLAPTIIYDELVCTNQIYARGVSEIPRSFLQTIPSLNLRQA